EYFSANKSMGPISISICLMVSFMSAITLLGVSAENYTYGAIFVIINFSYLIGTPIVCYGYLPVFYKLQATSTYEYLEKRFGGSARILASSIVWLQMLLYSGIVLYAPALAFKTTTGMEKLTSILSVGLACAFYSSIGGIKAVLITDIFQAFLMFASLIIIIATAASSVGGLDKIWEIAGEGGRLNFNNFSLDPTERHTCWGLIIGGIGLAIYSKYFNCDPVTITTIKKNDMLMPLYIMDMTSSLPGLPGLFVAGIFSAGLSTISAALNALAAISLEDYIKPLYFICTGKEFSPKKSLICSKVLAFILGIFCILLAILAQYLNSILQMSLTIFGVVGGPLVGLFTLGMLFESSTQRGAIFGTTLSLIFLIWISFGGPRPFPQALPMSVEGCNSDLLAKFNGTLNFQNNSVPKKEFFYLYRISYLWYAPIGVVMTIVVGWITSNLLQSLGLDRVKKNLDPDLFFPCIARRIRSRNRNNCGEESSEANLKKYQVKDDVADAKTQESLCT
ncbi:Similar to CG32669: Putative sodium-dependent multivitamin transporter (Drosophila melanogaster), partial [Cotesia congregata]